MILVMGRGYMSGIVDKKTLAIRFHGVTGQTEFGSFSPSHFPGHTEKAAKDWQTKHGYKGENLSASGSSYCRSSDKHTDNNGAEKDQTYDQTCRMQHRPASFPRNSLDSVQSSALAWNYFFPNVRM